MAYGKSALIAFVAFEATRSGLYAALRTFGIAEARAKHIAYEAGVTASAMIATIVSILTHDYLGAALSAAFLTFTVLERQKRVSKRGRR